MPATPYSVDASLTFRVVDPSVASHLTLKSFTPNDPRIEFLNDTLDANGNEIYVDITWGIDANSPDAAKQAVNQKLPHALTIPLGVELIDANLGGGGGFTVYNNQGEFWY